MVLGACFLYWISARAGRRVIYRLGHHVGLTPEQLNRAGQELHRRGWRALVIGRLTPGLRVVTQVACGLLSFPFRVYLQAVSVGAFIYLLIYTLLGYVFGHRVLQLVEALDVPLGVVIPAILLSGMVYWTMRIRRRTTHTDAFIPLSEPLWAGAAAGMLAALEAVLLTNVLIHLLALFSLGAPGQALGKLLVTVGGEIGRAPAVTVTSLLIPALMLAGGILGAWYGAWVGEAPRGGGPIHGAAYAFLPLATSLFVALPLLGAGPAGLALGAGLAPALGETIRHLTFGLVLGILYPALVPRPCRERPAPSPASEKDQLDTLMPSTELRP